MTSDDARAQAAPTAATRAAHTAAPPPLALATACPRCGAAVPSEGSDFCEHCSAHLYPGHCVFCLEPFSSGQQHCRRCGLPPEGLVCGACGTFSRFDFCPNPDCGAGLTPRAAEELARVEADPEVREAFAELDEIAAVVAAVEADQPLPEPAGPAVAAEPERAAQPAAEPDRAAQAASPVSEAEPAAQPVAPATTAKAAAPAPRLSLASLRAAAQGAKSAEEKARVRKLAEQAAQDALNAVSSRPFPTAQEARAAGTALQVALRCRVVTERLETIAWRCHRFNTEHPEPGGMSLCSDPASGGVPIMRVITEIDDRSTEFST
ncbi:MAG: hypothetical protein AB7R55_01650 [Gemmatimonadales bacterium]